MGEDLQVEYHGEESKDSADHVMSPLMDVLQTLGVSAADSANYCCRAIKNAPIMPLS